METLTEPPTAPELLGTLVGQIHQQAMLRESYIDALATSGNTDAYRMWHELSADRGRTEYRLYERMRKESLAQVVTPKDNPEYKARIEMHDNMPFVALYRVTETGEERWAE